MESTFDLGSGGVAAASCLTITTGENSAIAEICSVGADLPALFPVGGSLTRLVPAMCPRLAYLSRQAKLGTSALHGEHYISLGGLFEQSLRTSTWV